MDDTIAFGACLGRIKTPQAHVLPFMAHQVLARKYRPQRFADVAGQQHVTVTLMSALRQGRIAHGYIFSGHRGIGKTTIARILAMALNCHHSIGSSLRPTSEPCELCESCIEIRAGNSVDVIEIDAATNRGIDEIRELREAARYRPARDRYKIYILDEAHQITDAAFNALLKTLEEPPDHMIFMMATTQPEDIPATVRSRCQNFSFHAVKMSDILAELRGIAREEGVEADESALSLLAEAGDGSMRDALSILDQAIASAPMSGGRPTLDASQIRELMGVMANTVFERMLEAVDGGRSAEVLTIANELMETGNSPAQIARQLVRFLRNCLMAKLEDLGPDGTTPGGSESELLQISPDEQRRAGRCAAFFREEELTRFLQIILKTFDDLAYRHEQRFHLELGLLKLVHLRRLLPLEELLSQFPERHGSGPGVLAPTAASRPAYGHAVGVSTGSGPVASGSITLKHERTSAFGTTPDQSRFLGKTTAPQTPEGSPSVPKQEQEGSLAPSPSTTGARDARLIPTPGRGDVIPPPASSESPIEEDSAQTRKIATVRGAAVAALRGGGGQDTAAEALEDAEWMLDGIELRVQTAVSKTMLPVTINGEADKVVRAVVRAEGDPGWKLVLLPGKGGSKLPKEKTIRSSGASGTVQAKAEEHPIVQQAQRLFHAEIRSVIDLSESK